MVESIVTVATQIAVEIITIVVGSFLIYLGNKAKKVLDTVKAKDDLGIIDAMTDRAVEFAEAELKGASGIEKRDYALQVAERLLRSRGIEITDEEILAGIENGVLKLHEKQKLK